MALVVKQNKRLLHPTEKYTPEGSSEPEPTWFVARLPLSAGDIENMAGAENMMQAKLMTIVGALQEWSYPEPINLENVRRLDTVTFSWLYEQIDGRSRIGDEEKNASSSSSPPSMERGVELSQASSGS